MVGDGWRLDGSKPVNNNANKEREGTKKEHKVNFTISNPKYKLSDLIIAEKVFDEIQTIVNAEKCWNTVFDIWGLSSVMKDNQNLVVNLYGEPGTGKTMAAHAIANELDKKIICVNYAEIESKYVGETSKNLTALFKYAFEKDVIIFFDEADALLSKRVTDMSSSTDVSVNQTRSVLLTLMNDYKGMIIFASNFISNYDSAFLRRIQYHIEFELPNEVLRQKLWKKYIPDTMPNNIDIEQISNKYAGISGSDISNAVLRAALYAANRNENMVQHRYFENEIENIIRVKNANAKTKSVIKKEVSEEYVEEQISKGGE